MFSSLDSNPSIVLENTAQNKRDVNRARRLQPDLERGSAPKLSDALYLRGYRIFLTMCTYGRRPYFERPEIVDVVLSECLRSASTSEIEVVAYCFMPDRLHALIA